VSNWLEHVKLLLFTILLSGVVIAGIVLAAIAIPIVIGIGIVLASYVTIRVLNEDSKH